MHSRHFTGIVTERVDPVIQRIRGDWYDRNFKDGGLGGKSTSVAVRSCTSRVTWPACWMCGCAETPHPAASGIRRPAEFRMVVEESIGEV